jgi:hypothetical protein
MKPEPAGKALATKAKGDWLLQDQQLRTSRHQSQSLTSSCWESVQSPCRGRRNKVFLLLFLQKKKNLTFCLNRQARLWVKSGPGLLASSAGNFRIHFLAEDAVDLDLVTLAFVP